MYYVYINKHMHVYILENSVYILNTFIYIINYMNINIDVNTYKYFRSTYCMSVYIYNKYTQNTHTYIMKTKTFILYLINCD